MKKLFLLMFAMSTIISCDTDESSIQTNHEPESNEQLFVQESDVKNLIFQGEVYDIEVVAKLAEEKDKNKILKDYEQKLISAINSENLILYYDGTENMRLFNNQEAYNNYMSGFTNKSKNELSSSSKIPVIGYAVCWENPNYSGQQLYYREDLNPGSQFIAITPYPGGGTWNNRISSIRVNNGAMEFHSNYSPAIYDPGFTLVVHDPNNDPTQAVGINNLANVSMVFWISWNDAISQSRWLLTQP